MKKALLIPLPILVLSLGGYVFHMFNSTGYFRDIDGTFEGSIHQSISLPGVEDLQIDREAGFAILSSDDRAARRDGHNRQGHLYYLDLNDSTLTPRPLTAHLARPFFPHGISMIRLDSGLHKIYAVNHVAGEHSIEAFHLYGDSLVFVETLQDASMVDPNDIVALDETRFYFTNDHGYAKGLRRTAEEYLGLSVSNVIYFDGVNYRQVADGIAYANGINIDAHRKLLFVASPRAFLVKVYSMETSGDLTFLEDIDCGTGVDNIDMDEDGKLWIGCHPSLLHYSAYAANKRNISPSEIITIDYRGEGDYSVESVFTDDGNRMTSCTVAATYKDLILTGNVMDDHFLVLRKN